MVRGRGMECDDYWGETEDETRMQLSTEAMAMDMDLRMQNCQSGDGLS
jgi:hypothetical protein